MCPLPAWANWSLWVLQVGMAVAALVAFVYMVVTSRRRDRAIRKTEAEWNAHIAAMRRRFENDAFWSHPPTPEPPLSA